MVTKRREVQEKKSAKGRKNLLRPCVPAHGKSDRSSDDHCQQEAGSNTRKRDAKVIKQFTAFDRSYHHLSEHGSVYREVYDPDTPAPQFATTAKAK